MMINQKSKKELVNKLKGISAAAALGLALFTVSPTASVLATSEEKPKFEFGLVPDAQYCDCDAPGTRYYRHSLDKLREASQTFNEHDLGFTVQLGDLIDRNISSFSSILPIFNTIEGPKYHVLGNHDFPVTTDEVVDILGMPNQYYDFKYKNWRFVVLDTNDLSLYANPADSEKYQQAVAMYNSLKADNEINAQTWNGGISNEQLTWLRGVLNKAAQTNEKVVVFSHMPVYPKNNHNVWNDDEVIKELEAAGNVVAYFNGHNHAGNYGVKNGIHYVNLKGMVETADTNSYSIIQVYKDRLEIDGYGREQDRVLEIQ
jgi:predicted phosphodiesterase